MKVGVQLPEVEYVYTWAELREMALVAEDVGLDSIWYGDHLMYRDRPPGAPPSGPFEAWTTLAALAAVTSRVTLGPLVASIGFHAPAMLAKMAATLDVVSEGRFVLGLGSGWSEPEYRGFGFAFDRRAARFAESLTIVRVLFATGACTFHGEFNDLDDALLFPTPVTPGGPPLMLGSHGPRMLEIALPHAAVMMWNAWYEAYGNDRTRLPRLLAEIDAACARVGRDPATLERTVCPLVRMPGDDARRSRDTSTALDGQDAGALVAELAALRDLGIGHVMLVLDPVTAETIAALGPVVAALRR